MKTMIALVGALATLCVAGVAGSASGATVKTWPVAVRTLNAPAPPGYHVFWSASEWRVWQSRAKPSRRNGPTSPNVRWDREMVVSAGMGEKPTAGYDVRITSVARVGSEIVVTVRETTPPFDAIVAQVITYPSHTVAVKRMAGPVVFVVNGRRTSAGSLPVASARPSGATRPRGDAAPSAPDAASLAKSLFILQESGGIAGLNRQTIVHLYGRPIRPGEGMTDARETREARVAGPVIRMVEKVVRDSGFMDLDARYAATRPIADGMARTIRVQLGGRVKTVTVEDGATSPKAFDDTWQAIQTAINSRGTMVTPWGTRG